MEFAKLHGLGNDFIVAKAGTMKERPFSLGDLARRVCDRHCGIGADGILFYEATVGDAEADFSALIFNADGSRAEISGNGVRCMAALLHLRGEMSNRLVRIRTTAGIKILDLISQKGPIFVFRTSLGYPITDPSRTGSPAAGSGPTASLPIGSDSVPVTITSMGNPHCSTFWPDLAVVPFERLGPAIEHHSWFANRTNVEFIQVLDRHRLRVRFWERGVGATLASGTGSSAAAVASVLNGYVESPITVETELGSLLVEWNPGAELFLTGPAEFICRGDYSVFAGESA